MIKDLLKEPITRLILAGITALLGLEVWQTKAIADLTTNQSVQAEKIRHIDEAVNNAGEGEATLRELVKQNQLMLEYIKGRLSPYPDPEE